ncbi:MAG: DUF302 domain-containing protein [Mangrovicoccus sp.]
MTRFGPAIALCLSFALPGLAFAQAVTSWAYDGDFEDATFAVESAIIDKGLVVDHVSHVGEMLNRTGADLGTGQAIFEQADVFLFCSAVISRQVMQADPMNIAHCPYGVFVAQQGATVTIGFRTMPAGQMQVVQQLLTEIIEDALEY